jgi:chaperonin GroEL
MLSLPARSGTYPACLSRPPYYLKLVRWRYSVHKGSYPLANREDGPYQAFLGRGGHQSRCRPTEVELKERKARVEDALSATRSAVEEGIVPGGGVALVRAQRALSNITGLSGDEAVGVSIVRRALEQPLKLIVENAGYEGSVVLNQVKQQADDYGAEVGEFGPMLQRGIVNPAKVTHFALQNATSVAAMVLTTESMVTEIPEQKSAAPAMPPMDY